MRLTSMALAALLVLGMLSAVPATAAVGNNLEHTGFIPFPTNGEGTDSDFITYDIDPSEVGVDVRTVGVFGSIGSGAWILDVTDGKSEPLAFYSCSIGQGDIQTFQQHGRTFFTFTDDGYTTERAKPSGCQAWGATDPAFSASNKQGTFIVDITDPRAPKNIEFVPFALGSHNMTVHPSGNFLYNSNSELIDNAVATPVTRGAGIEVWEISNLGNDEPINHGVMALPVRPGLGTDSHDITFNDDGTRAYSAALSQTVIINTENPAVPSVVSSFVDPAINVEHQANMVTLDDPILGERDFLIIEDEFGGAAGAEQTCPSGGTHVYDISDETTPVKVGSWYIDDITTRAAGLGRCTAHVFDIHPEAGIMTMSFYNAGVRVIDISGLVGLSVGGVGVGMKEIGYHRFVAGDQHGISDSWSFKAAEVDVAEDGTISATMYSNDVSRGGIDVYKFTGTRAAATGNGTWYAGTSWLDLNGPSTMPADYKPFCLIGNRDLAAPALVAGI